MNPKDIETALKIWSDAGSDLSSLTSSNPTSAQTTPEKQDEPAEAGFHEAGSLEAGPLEAGSLEAGASRLDDTPHRREMGVRPPLRRNASLSPRERKRRKSEARRKDRRVHQQAGLDGIYWDNDPQARYETDTDENVFLPPGTEKSRQQRDRYRRETEGYYSSDEQERAERSKRNVKCMAAVQEKRRKESERNEARAEKATKQPRNSKGRFSKKE